MQLRQNTKKIVCFLIYITFSLPFFAVYSAENIPPGSTLPKFELNSPQSPEEKTYLGLKNEKQFSLSQVKTKFLLVEFFDVFCPVCQKNAPVVNRVYSLISKDKNLSKDIKMIGIGIESNAQDLDVYRKFRKVEFPLFTDPQSLIKNKVKSMVTFVPLVLLLDKNNKVLLSHFGLIDNFDAFINQIREKSKS
jgi:thiol-disulfide isomerase/thioredoxin